MTRIGRWQVDVARRLLKDGTRTSRLAPRSWEVLDHLLEHRGELVRTQTLLERFWRGQIGDEAYVRKTISQIRTALGSDRDLISTVPKQGYVLEADDARRNSAPSAAPVVAVLPFASFSSDPENEHFCDGLTEEVVNKVSQRLRTPVIARTSTFQFKGVGSDIRAIGQALGASHVLEGSVRTAAERVRITAQLIEAAAGSHLWSETYERDLADVFAVQDEVAERVSREVEQRVEPGDSQGSGETVYLSKRFLDPADFRDLVALILEADRSRGDDEADR